MSLWVLPNDLNLGVANDLKMICPDAGLSVDLTSGRVSYTQTQSSVGCDLIATLVSHSGWVGIRGERPDFSYSPQPGHQLRDVSGVTVFDRSPGTRTVEIVYDVTNCGGNGYFAYLFPGTSVQFPTKIDHPTHVALFHELSHAKRLLLGTEDANSVDRGALDDENQYRSSLHPALPARGGLEGGCKAAPAMPPAQPSSGTGGCFIATAAYGSPLEPEVELLRRFRDNVLRQTRAGRAFFDRYWRPYYRVSPAIADLMRRDPDIREIVSWSFVTPIVQHLQLLLRFPDAPIDGIEEPWKSFLIETRDSLEAWATAIEPPYEFETVPASEAAVELEIILRYVLRRAETRAAYLDRLEDLGQLPLRTSMSERAEIAERLRASGRSDAEVQRILGPLAKHRSPLSLGLRAAIGNDHVLSQGQFNPSEWIYTVTIQNLTPATFDEIVLFYKRTDMATGVIFWHETNVLPGDVRVFRLCVCNKLESYVLQFFQGEEFQNFPESGVMTPALASQLSPMDTEPCADSWSIGP